ncbi:hypothetical protein HLH34_14375 [Gluconacetobacter azotocaptans]|uniref:Uncharacterized protein n=1 Tax=Gluconacetobacter azotocaptans TaxID=142834 RepID=A0A7W4JUI0_9PROT|nr:hypothetical protein [Gluconacetobacter azotocaptans]MBB2191134.1 hypothetical protein [Gluconacetobacter azotocaptans]MBM9402255.1 hypothetical protein [Gluconacetobacter azotocaptans]GBQ37051.1 hypothetical protein AA13594_3383 [Gluconacetobacter azotocaptans DSM 13594]
MCDEGEAIVGYLVVRECGDDEVEFWDPENEWSDDPDEGKLYETEDEAEQAARDLRAGDTATITVEPVFEDDEEDEDDAS